MQIVRTILWVLLAVALLGFSFFNWKPVEVQIWDNLVLETKVPALVIVSFLLGILPMWLLHRGTKWRLERRIKTLENAMQANSMSQQAAKESVAASSTTSEPSVAPAPTSPLSPSDPKADTSSL